MFLVANVKKYRLIDTNIQAVKMQRVGGINLVRLKDKKLERWGILGGPAECIVALVEKLKVTKGLVKPGNSDYQHATVSAPTSVLLDRVRDPSHFSYLGADLSLLEELGHEERRVREIFDQIEQSNRAWTQEVEDVQPNLRTCCW